MRLICADTTVLSDGARGKHAVRERILSAEGEGARFCTTAVNVYEAGLGIERVTNKVERAQLVSGLDRILSALPVLPFDLEASRKAAAVGASLYARGRPAGAMDLLTAATAAAAGCEAILTRNVGQFRRMELVEVVSY